MRVNQPGNNSVQSAEASNAQKTSRAGKAAQAQSAKKNQATDVSGSVNAEISTKGKDMAKAKAVAGQAPDVREAKIAELRQRIAEGKYNVKPDAIADKLVDEHLSTADLG